MEFTEKQVHAHSEHKFYHLTSSIKSNLYYIKVGAVDSREASAIISQIRLIDTKRLSNKIGRVNENTFDKIKKATKDLL